MIEVTSKGEWKKTVDFLNEIDTDKGFLKDINLNEYGRMGVNALSNATPVDTSLTADSWGYKIIKNKDFPGIVWFNTNVIYDTPVVILIQYGHATGTGGYVQGRDFINPVMQPLFDQIAEDIWKKVKL